MRAIVTIVLPLTVLQGCAAIVTPAPVSQEELHRLASDGECVAASPGNRLPGFRCTGDYGSFD